MKRKKNAVIRICKRGQTERRFNTNINGDFYTCNKTYRESLNFILLWEPSERLKIWVNKFCKDYALILKHENVEVKFNYPRDFEDLAAYILDKISYNGANRDVILNSNNYKLLERLLELNNF